MKLKVWRDPYGNGVPITVPSEIDLVPGLTVLVGCNGAGKSTLLSNIREQAKKDKIPCHMFDNLVDGGNSSLHSFASGIGSPDDLFFGIQSFNSSEGERIRINLAKQVKLYKDFMSEGHFKDANYNFYKLFADEEDSVETNDRILLYDAVDSGMSIDAVQDIKNLFHKMLQDAAELNVNLYIIISANEFELCLGENCLDVVSGKYLKFYTYPKFKTFIINSRKIKERRLEREEKCLTVQKAKEQKQFEIKKKSFLAKLEKMKARSKGNNLLYSDKSRLMSELSDFSRNCKCCKFNEEIAELRELLYKM